MTQLTMSQEDDLRSKKVSDPALGTGRMLLHASNYSLRLYGMDIDPLVVKISKINGALYAPWMSFPLPASFFGNDVAQLNHPTFGPKVHVRKENCSDAQISNHENTEKLIGRRYCGHWEVFQPRVRPIIGDNWIILTTGNPGYFA